MKKWIVLTASVCLQGVLGGVYAWSAFVPSLTKNYGFTNGQAGLIFGLTIAVFTIAMVPAGKFLEKFGPRMIATTGAILFTLGYLIASISGGSYLVVLIGIGIISGIGIGAGYVCPLTVGMKWFPDHKGLVTGVAVAGFGGGATVLSFFIRFFIKNLGYNVLQVFGLVGLIFGGIAIIASLFLSEPDKDTTSDADQLQKNFRINSCIFSRPFVLFCISMFAGTFAGLLTIGNLKPLLLHSGLAGKTATLGISIFAIGNAIGRIAWGQIHDKLGVRCTIVLSLSCLALSTLLLAFNLPAIVLLITVAVIGASFGACFVVYASSIVRIYGTHAFPCLYPICFLWYGLAGILGPTIGGKIADVTGSFNIGIFLSASIVFIALILNAVGLFLSPKKQEIASVEACEETLS